MTRRLLALVLAIGPVLLTVSLPASTGRQLQAGGQPVLDAVLARYVDGDSRVIARTFVTASDFHAARLGDARRLDRWLGDTWHRGKAALLLELAHASTPVAPQYVVPLIRAGQRYLRVVHPAGSGTSDITFIRIWHRIAVGLLLHHGTPAMIEDYVASLIGPPGQTSVDDSVDARLLFARAVAHERTCSDLRPDRDRPGADLRRLARAAGDDLPAPDDLTSSPKAIEASRWHECLGATIARYEAAGAMGNGYDEARLRAAWLLFQQGDSEHALQWLEPVNPGDDEDLAYWTSLFRGRVLDALGRRQDAADAYASALAVRPGAQSASIGLSLALFRLDRTDEADELARSVRAGTDVIDPWWVFAQADYRFVDRWLADLRGELR